MYDSKRGTIEDRDFAVALTTCKARITIETPDAHIGIWTINCNQETDHTGPHTGWFFETKVRWTQ